MQQNRLVCLSIVFIANLCMFIYVFIDQVYCLFFIAQRISIDLLSTHIRIEQLSLICWRFIFLLPLPIPTDASVANVSCIDFK